MEEPQRKEKAEQRDGAAVVRVEDRLRPRGGNDVLEPIRDRRERFVPRRGLESPGALRPDPSQWPGQPRLRVTPLAVVGDRTLGAQFAATHEVAGIAAHLSDPAAALEHHDATAVVAIARTSGQ